MSVLWAAVVLSLAVAVSSSGAGGGADCSSGQLRGRMLDSTGAAGTILVSVTLRNAGGVCWMQGYASVRLANRHGLLPTHDVHGGFPPLNQPSRRVVLARGRFASVLIAYSHVTVGAEKTCAHSTRLLLRPPGQPGWINVAVQADACNHGRLYESPILTGIRHT